MIILKTLTLSASLLCLVSLNTYAKVDIYGEIDHKPMENEQKFDFAIINAGDDCSKFTKALWEKSKTMPYQQKTKLDSIDAPNGKVKFCLRDYNWVHEDEMLTCNAESMDSLSGKSEVTFSYDSNQEHQCTITAK